MTRSSSRSSLYEIRGDSESRLVAEDGEQVVRVLVFPQEQGVVPGRLHGIRRDLQRSLVGDGWRMRVYIPFGTEWYPYLMRRLAERPANVLFIARNLLRR